MGADVHIKMNTETYQALRALLQYDVSGDRDAFVMVMRSQGRNVDKVDPDMWRPAIAEEAIKALKSS